MVSKFFLKKSQDKKMCFHAGHSLTRLLNCSRRRPRTAKSSARAASKMGGMARTDWDVARIATERRTIPSEYPCWLRNGGNVSSKKNSNWWIRMAAGMAQRRYRYQSRKYTATHCMCSSANAHAFCCSFELNLRAYPGLLTQRGI